MIRIENLPKKCPFCGCEDVIHVYASGIIYGSVLRGNINVDEVETQAIHDAHCKKCEKDLIQHGVRQY